VWESAKANMRMYLLLKERAQEFRADPVVQEALRDSKVLDLETPTLAPGETYQDLLNDKSAFEDYDVDAAGAQGYHFVRLHQLAIDHLVRAS
jgi:xylose isomerase